MKKVKWFHILLFVLVAVVLYILYDTNFSEYAKIGRKNVKNAEKIRIGMSIYEVISIMGSPVDSSYKPKLRNGRHIPTLHYPSYNDDYVEIEINFDTSNHVSDFLIPYLVTPRRVRSNDSS